MLQHPSDVELQRLADDGIVAVSAAVVAHVRDCATCASLVRYARAAKLALRGSAPALTASDELLHRFMHEIANCALQRQSDTNGDNDSVPTSHENNSKSS